MFFAQYNIFLDFLFFSAIFFYHILMKKILIPNKNFLKNIYLFDIEYDNILFNDIMLFIEDPFIRNLKHCEIMLNNHEIFTIDSNTFKKNKFVQMSP